METDTALVDDVARYLRFADDDPVTAVEQFEVMRSRYRAREFPGGRYEFRDAPGEDGVLVAPPSLDRVAAERDRYETGSDEREALDSYLDEFFHAGGTMAHDVYADGGAVWVDDGESMERIADLQEALPLDELVEAYEMVRDMGAAADAKEQFDRMTSLYRVGPVDADGDVVLYYDTAAGRGFLFDTFEIDIRPVDGSLAELLDEMDPGHPDGDVADSLDAFLSGDD